MMRGVITLAAQLLEESGAVALCHEWTTPAAFWGNSCDGNLSGSAPALKSSPAAPAYSRETLHHTLHHSAALKYSQLLGEETHVWPSGLEERTREEMH